MFPELPDARMDTRKPIASPSDPEQPDFRNDMPNKNAQQDQNEPLPNARNRQKWLSHRIRRAGTAVLCLYKEKSMSGGC
jgi:hypothetical protein